MKPTMFLKSKTPKYPSDWPPQAFLVDRETLTRNQIRLLKSLVRAKASETKVGAFLDRNRNIVGQCLSWSQTGHHGTWVVPQQLVRPPQRPILHGLKPDYLVGGKNSDGFSWYVVELKGANQRLLSGKGTDIRFSSTANAAILQLLAYIDYCTEAQSYLRDTLKLTDFRSPSGVLFIGTGQELENVHYRKLRAAWNHLLGEHIEIRSYDSLVRASEEEIRFQAGRKQPKN